MNHRTLAVVLAAGPLLACRAPVGPAAPIRLVEASRRLAVYRVKSMLLRIGNSLNAFMSPRRAMATGTSSGLGASFRTRALSVDAQAAWLRVR